jgi:hypothetical protein
VADPNQDQNVNQDQKEIAKQIKEEIIKEGKQKEETIKGELTKEEEFRVFYNIYTIYSI